MSERERALEAALNALIAEIEGMLACSAIYEPFEAWTRQHLAAARTVLPDTASFLEDEGTRMERWQQGQPISAPPPPPLHARFR